MELKIVRNDITTMRVDAIVNPANSAPAYGPGCDAAIYKAAGEKELLALRDKIGYINAGQAFITPGLALPAQYIIHAVSPRFLDGRSGEEELLRHCYRNACRVALENDVKSIAFPILATGSFGYPKEEGMRIALDELENALGDKDIRVYLVVFDKDATELGRKIDPNLESYIDSHYVDQTGQREQADRPDRTRQWASIPVRSDQRAESKKKNFGFFGSMFKSRPAVSTPEENIYAIKSSVPEAAELEPNGEEDRFLLKTSSSTPDEDVKGQAMDYCVSCPSLDSEEISTELSERMAHMSDSFQQYLFFLIDRKGMSNSEVYKRGILDKRLFAKIKADENYHPKKITAMQLCVGLMLNLDETKDLLARAGYALSPCDKTDVIFSYFIEHEVYDMIEIDIQLEEHGLPCLIA